LAGVEYTYDLFDRRIARKIDADGNGVFETTQRFVYDGEDLILAFSGSTNALTNRYLYGPATDEILADEQLSTTSTSTAGTVTWSLGDNLGTIRDLVQYNAATATATVVNHVRYDTFGQIVSQTNSQFQPWFAYTGREWDPAAGLYFYRARWYDPRAGRFTSEDPLGFAAGDVNLSRYVGNGPTLWVDPSGMDGLPPNLSGPDLTLPNDPPVLDGTIMAGGSWNPANWVGRAGFWAAHWYFRWNTGQITTESNLLEQVKKIHGSVAVKSSLDAEEQRRIFEKQLKRPIPEGCRDAIKDLAEFNAGTYGGAFEFTRPIQAGIGFGAKNAADDLATQMAKKEAAANSKRGIPRVGQSHPSLPVRKHPKDPTHGILDDKTPFVSGQSPATDQVFAPKLSSLTEDARTSLKHVEGHAVAEMMAKNMAEAVLHINYKTGPCPYCKRGIPELLNEGQKLWVVFPDGVGFFTTKGWFPQ
jgi:RHS repeat-associated protein